MKIIAFLLIFSSFLHSSYKKHTPYLKSFQEASKIYNVELKLLLAVCKTESGFNPKAFHGSNKNGTADRGMMQINNCHFSTLRKYLSVDIKKAIYNPDYNIKVGAWVLNDCQRMFGRTWKAVDCYNKGAKNAKNNSRYIHNVWKNYQFFTKLGY